MPVSYDNPSLLKCNVSFTYTRYYLEEPTVQQPKDSSKNPNSPGNPENNNPIENVLRNTDSTGQYISNTTDPTLQDINRYTNTSTTLSPTTPTGDLNLY